MTASFHGDASLADPGAPPASENMPLHNPHVAGDCRGLQHRSYLETLRLQTLRSDDACVMVTCHQHLESTHSDPKARMWAPVILLDQNKGFHSESRVLLDVGQPVKGVIHKEW